MQLASFRGIWGSSWQTNTHTAFRFALHFSSVIYKMIGNQLYSRRIHNTLSARQLSKNTQKTTLLCGKQLFCAMFLDDYCCLGVHGSEVRGRVCKTAHKRAGHFLDMEIIRSFQFFSGHNYTIMSSSDPAAILKRFISSCFCPLLIGLMHDMARSQVMTLRWFKCDIGFLGRPDLCPSLLSTLSLTPQTQFSRESSALVHVIKRFACLSPSTKSAPLRTIKKTAYRLGFAIKGT